MISDHISENYITFLQYMYNGSQVRQRFSHENVGYNIV